MLFIKIKKNKKKEEKNMENNKEQKPSSNVPKSPSPQKEKEEYENKKSYASQRYSRSHSRSHSPHHSRSHHRSDNYSRKPYYRYSRSPRMKYHRKTSRENSAENTGNVLYVSNFPKYLRDDEIKEKFDKYGKVININIIKEPHSKENRGFGFVTFDSSKDAQKAMNEINNMVINGKEIKVEISKRSKPHKPTPGVYLGPKSDYYRRRYDRNFYYRGRERSRSRSRSYDRYNRHSGRNSRSRSRSRSRSFNRGRR